ncbi:hypothetical protein LguiB_008807 [Lonicera macranthoides]
MDGLGFISLLEGLCLLDLLEGLGFIKGLICMGEATLLSYLASTWGLHSPRYWRMARISGLNSSTVTSNSGVSSNSEESMKSVIREGERETGSGGRAGEKGWVRAGESRAGECRREQSR